MRILERIVFSSIGLCVGYIALAIFTDVRIDRLRPFITQTAVNEGVAAGIAEYEKRNKEWEPIRAKKRKIRDEAIRKYLRRIKEISEGEVPD